MKIIVSGGGTAGHIYPALAVADELRSLGHEVLFVGALGKMEMERVPKNGYTIIGLPVVGLRRSLSPGSIVANLAFPFKLYRSIRRARKIIEQERPDVVVGFGGYASAPIVRAAQSASVPTVLQEQNSYAGMANRMLAKKAVAICTAYDGMERFFPAEKITITGNPLRGNISSLPSREEAIAHFKLDPKKHTILVTGGSLGTRTLNEMVMAYQLPKDVQIIWQTGRFYIDEFTERTKNSESNFSEHLILPFVERMDYAYAAADVVVCRAGASTVSELQLIGKPTIFVPSPNVAEDHQTANARALVARDAALMIADNRAIAEGLHLACELLTDKERMERMAGAMRAMGLANAASDVAQIVIKATVKR